MTRPTLRQYQRDNLNEVYEKHKTMQAGIWCLATGGGKGTGASAVIHHEESIGHRVLFLVYGQLLVQDQFERVTNLGIDAGMITGSSKAENRKPWCSTQIASISTLHKRKVLPKCDLLICDEIQDSTSKTFRSVINRYLADGVKLLGLSATPIGPNGVGLGRKAGGVFDFMVTGPSVKKLIKDEYLVSCRLYCFDSDSLKGIKKKGDDYDRSALAALAAADVHRVGSIVENWKLYASDRKTAAFGVDKADAMRIKEQFSIQGINATTIFDDTSAEDRKQMWEDFDHGDLRVVSAVNVIGRGVDHPILKCVIDGAGSLSVQRVLQRWGRGSRPHRGYDNFVLLDFCGNYLRHGRYEADRTWSLEGGQPKTFNDGEPDFRIRTCQKCRLPFKLGPKACPRCGTVIQIKEREVREIDGRLRLIDTEEEAAEIKREQQQEQKAVAIENWKSHLTDEQKLAKLDEWKNKARDNGYSAGWAYSTYRRTFNGEDPPKMKAPPPPEISKTLNDWNNL
jgi:DNA repair protein RadD